MVRVRRAGLAKATPRQLQNLRTRKLEKRSRAAAVRAGVSFQDTRLVGSRRSAAGPAGPWNFPPVAAGNMPAAVAAGARMYVHHIDPVLVFRSAGRIGGVTLLQMSPDPRPISIGIRRFLSLFLLARTCLETGPRNGTRVAIRVPPGSASASHGIHGQAGAPVVIRPVIM